MKIFKAAKFNLPSVGLKALFLKSVHPSLFWSELWMLHFHLSPHMTMPQDYEMPREPILKQIERDNNNNI